MSLRKDVEKATSLKWVNNDNNDAKFIRLQGLSQAAKDRKMNEKKVKKPQNIHLVEDSDNDSDDCFQNFMYHEKHFDKHAISAAIKEMNGGLDLSNEHWEKSWANQLKNIEKEKSQQSSRCNVKTYSENQSEDLDNKNDFDIQKCIEKLRRNAAIMGIVNNKNISLEDFVKNKLEVSNKASTNLVNNDDDNEDDDNNDNNDDSDDSDDNDNDNDYNYVESVPHDEEDGIFIHPFQKGIDTTKHKDIDFTLPRIGKKTKITPKTHFLDIADEACFNFVKKKI